MAANSCHTLTSVNTGTPRKIIRWRHILLPHRVSAETDCLGAGRYHSLAASALLLLNLQGCSLRGWLFCTGGSLEAAKKPLAPFIILNERLWEFLLEWVGMSNCTEAAKDFPSLTSVPPTHHTTPGYKVGILIPSLNWFACPATSPAETAGHTLEENTVRSWNSTHETAICMEMTACSYCAQGFMC